MGSPDRTRAVVFDLDGTLLDTAPDLIGSVNRLRRERGLKPIADGLLRPAAPHGSGPLIRRAFNAEPDDADFEALRQRFLAIYREHLCDETRPFPGVNDLLDELDGRGVPWAIVTNKPAWLTEPLLKTLGYWQRAAHVVSGDTVPNRKPDPLPIRLACERMGVEPGNTITVGDAQRDIRAGKTAGAVALIALFGYTNGEDRVCHWGADGLIGHPRELLRWFDWTRGRSIRA